jgi:hypothetical protein
MATITETKNHADYGEPDRASITANGIVVDVIANDDGSVYIECYAYGTDREVEVITWQPSPSVNHPNLTLNLQEA